MSLLRLNTEPSPRELRVFALVWVLFFSLAAGLSFQRGAPLPLVVVTAVVAVAIPGAGWVFPPVLRLAFVVLSYLTYPVGLVVSTVLLLAIYYLIFSPIGLMARIFGYDPLHRRFDARAQSYWHRRQPRDGLARYFRQS